MRTLYLFRHGQSESNVGGVYNNLSDPLTEAGRTQVQSAAAFVQGLKLDGAFVSPLERTEETAKLLGVSATSEDRLADWQFGEFAGKPFGSFGQYTREHGVDKRTFVPAGGESLLAFHERVVGFVRNLPAEGAFLIISHAGVLKNIIHAETGKAWDNMFPENASLWVIQDSHVLHQNWKPWNA